MNKKELDILELMRESISKANKDLGFVKSMLNEQKESAFAEPFDPEKHMPKFQITKNWGIKGTSDAKQIDAIVENLIDKSETNGLKRYKKTIEKMNSVLGTSYGSEESLPRENKPAQVFKINEIISSMQLKSLFHAVIGSQDAKVAGKVYETLVSRLAGGFAKQTETYSIEDFIDGENNYISVKVVKDTSPIEGSKTNLAIALAKKAPDEGIYYLVNVKDSEENPFKVNAFSFRITRGNFFYFVSGGKKSDESAIEEMAIIKNRLGIVGAEIRAKAERGAAEYEKKAKELAAEPRSAKKTGAKGLKEAANPQFTANVFFKENFSDALTAAYKELYPKEEGSFENVKEKFSELLDSAAKNISGDELQKNLFDNVMKVSAGGDYKNVADSINNIVTGAGSPKIFIDTTLKELQAAITKLDSLSGIDLAEFAENDPDWINKINNLKYKSQKLVDTKEATAEEQKNAIEAHIKNNEPKYVSIRNKIKANLKPFFNLYNKLNDAVTGPVPKEPVATTTYDKRASLQASRESGKTTGVAPEELDAFWDELKNVTMAETFAEILSEAEDKEAAGDDKATGKAKSTKFSMSPSTVKAIMKSDAGAQLDETYPQIVVTYEGLKDSTSASAEAFRNWAQPLYEGMHILTQGVNQYFIEDNVAGLTEADKGVKQVDGQVARLSKEGKGASALAEVKKSDKQILKKSALDDILIELLD